MREAVLDTAVDIVVRGAFNLGGGILPGLILPGDLKGILRMYSKGGAQRNANASQELLGARRARTSAHDGYFR